MVGGAATLPLRPSGISGIFPSMEPIAIGLTGVNLSILLLVVGWILGERLGDERGVLGYLMWSLGMAATVAWMFS